MQASKPISTNANKKCRNPHQTSPKDDCLEDENIDKRVLSLATKTATTKTSTSGTKPAPTNNNHKVSKDVGTQPVAILKQSSSNNSVDNEVESIVNRVQIESDSVSLVLNPDTCSNGNIHNKSELMQQFVGTNSAAQSADLNGDALTSSSSSLILVDDLFRASSIGHINGRTATTTATATTSSGASTATPTNSSTKLLEPVSICLDTKVPLAHHKHPVTTSTSNKINNNNFQSIQFKDDEVSYYNETQIVPKPDQPQSAGNSLDKCTRPSTKLLLAGFMGGKQRAEVYQNDGEQENCEPTRQQGLISSGYDEHNYMTADYNNLSDVHYNNAPVVGKEVALSNHRHRQADSSSGYPRYHEISSPVPALTTSNSSPTQDRCFAQHRTVSVSTSPKAKSAPATPCNVTPIAFHQNNSHVSSLNPNLANTLPPDIRKNISAATCHALANANMNNVTNGDGAGRRGQAMRTGGQPVQCRKSARLQQIHHNNNRQQQQAQTQQVVNTSDVPHASKEDLDNLMKRAELEMAGKNFESAIDLLSKCLNLVTEINNDSCVKKIFKMYSLRAEAYFELADYCHSIEDSMAARDLNPKWTRAYYLQGQAQFKSKKYADSLTVFSFGLTQDPNNQQLFDALVEAALNSDFGLDFQQKFDKLKSVQLDRRPFVVVAILGQELLAMGHCGHAVIILESALKLSSSTQICNPPTNGTSHQEGLGNQKKFQCSVLSTTSLAYSMLRDYDKAIQYMNKELDIQMELEDINDQCRVLNNLGYTYFKVRKFDKSLEAHRKQLNLAMKNHLYPQASQALNAIGHVHAAKDDFVNALTSHTRCLDILKQLDDDYYAQFKELLAIGHVHLMLNDLKAADEKFDEANQFLEQKHKMISHEEFNTGSIMIQFNLAHLALKKQSISKAIQHYQSVIDITRSFSGASSPGPGSTLKLNEMRACNGLGQAYRLVRKFDEAKRWFEEQLKLAKTLHDKAGQSRALCNLGMIYQHFEDHQKARQLFEENLELVGENPLLKAYAHSYMGSAYYLTNHLKESRYQYEESLKLFKELGYFTAEQRAIDQNIASIKRRNGTREVESSGPFMAQNNLANTNQKKVMLA